MASFKNEYNQYKEEYERLKTKAAELQGQKKAAEKELKEIDEQIVKKTKGKDPQMVIDRLDKEIESRLDMLRESVRVCETEVEEQLSGGSVTESCVESEDCEIVEDILGELDED